MNRSKVLVTGAAGAVGTVLLPALGAPYDVIALDRRRTHQAPAAVPAQPQTRFRRASITRLRPLVRAFADVDVVIHLAADSRLQAPWRSASRTNIHGTYTVLEAARISGVRRVIFASSNAVTAGYEKDEPWLSVIAGRYGGLDPIDLPRISTASPLRPTGPYAVSKVFGEAACRYYSDSFGLSTICVRIGSVNSDDRPHQLRDFATWLSNGDLARLMVAAIEAPADVGFCVFYGVSANTWRMFDISEAEAAIGFRPLDNAEAFRASDDAETP
jgi:nucleoside-diphosphate-sugar epimerase